MSRLLRVGLVVVVSLAVLSLALPQRAAACPTCFGDVDSPMTKGMNHAILLLLAIVGLVQVGFVKLFLGIRKRSRNLAERKDRFRIVDGGLQ